MSARTKSSQQSTASYVSAALLLLGLAGCGGQRVSPDFNLSVSPMAVSAVVGHDTSAAAVSIAPLSTGFNASVTVTVQGVPQAVTVSPGSSFSVASRASQDVTFHVADSAPVGVFPITITASGGGQSHNSQIMLNVEPIVTVSTGQSGSILYLESRAIDNARIGLETQWGGSIVEVSLNGNNFVNMHDTGREVQVAQYDGNARYDGCVFPGGSCGWNPVQGGDKYDYGSPLLEQTLNTNSLHVKAQGNQWNPDDKGGGPSQPVLGDTYVDATVTAVLDHAATFKVHYRITHFGLDTHANSQQEFPAVYVNVDYPRFVRYGGNMPWTNDAVSLMSMPLLPMGSGLLYAPEQWGAFVDSNDVGLTVFIPGVAPYVGGFAAAGDVGPTGSGTNYFAPFAIYTFGPGSVLEGDVYLIAGDYKHARQVVYDLHSRLPAVDVFTPFGSPPEPGLQISGTTSLSGWAVDDVAVSKVEIYVDGVWAGTAQYGASRPDVVRDFPGAPQDCGYTFSLDTRAFPNGMHTIEVKAVDTSGNIAVFPDVPVIIQN